MAWEIIVSRKVRKGVTELPKNVRQLLDSLIMEIRAKGPVRGDWPNYGKLSRTSHHCHLKNGRPTYVAVWEEIPGGINIVEVTYAGTHEGAPY